MLLNEKQRQKEEEAMHIEDTERLVTEIEMLKVLFCICVGQKKRVFMHEVCLTLPFI